MSVYKREKTWTAHAKWTDSKGKQHQKTKGGFPTRKVAQEVERSILTEAYSFIHAASAGGGYVRPSERPQPAYLLWAGRQNRNWNDAKTLYDGEAYNYLRTWQEYRCAFCGNDKANLVLDHCHESGLARGFLCSSCNTTEPRRYYDDVEWDIYRRFPPTALLKLKFYYNDFGSSPYPQWSVFPRSQIEINTKEWEDDFCYRVAMDYAQHSIGLEWMTKSEIQILMGA